MYPVVEKELVKKLVKALDIQGAKFSAGWIQQAQKLPEDMPIVVREFLQTLYVREVPIKTMGNEKLRFTVVLGYTVSREKLPPAVIFFKLKKKPKGKFPRDVVVTMAPCANMIGDLMISTYIPQVIRARPNGFFKSKDERKGKFTKKRNLKRASYELVYEWVFETWREISIDILNRSFEASGLTLNPDGSEDDKMTSRLQAIIANCLNEVCFSEEEDNESSNQDDVNNKSNPDELDDELYDESVTDDDSEDMMDIDN
ncbi:12168_t:CDS:2 [Dentiscutata erythropus]|uniref:12168_t:CDS:1 n=1 Tax=Dentiscutata erythropus TaxID=1348616 RepID=A0A9N9E1Q7_9GLOM|nr:12168_t:CDS:2 [Dentiscutata erythropus]